MKARECPYCHKRISIRKCTYYFWRGTRYTIHCNHCGQEVRPLKEPIPFNYTVVAGLLTSYISMEFFLYYIGLNFVDSLIHCIPIFAFAMALVMIIVLGRIKFIQNWNGCLIDTLICNLFVRSIGFSAERKARKGKSNVCRNWLFGSTKRGSYASLRLFKKGENMEANLYTPRTVVHSTFVASTATHDNV